MAEPKRLSKVRRAAAEMANTLRLDWRSILLFRFLLGTFLFLDLLEAFQCADVFYTSAGVLPRSLFSEIYRNSSVLSLHIASDQPYFIKALLLIQMAFAVMLAFNIRPRLASLVSWALFASLSNRNWFAADGGNQIGTFLLFASIYLPDRKPADADRGVLNVGSVMLILQLVVMYACAGWAKHGSPEWKTGVALDLTLRWDEYARPWAAALLSHPTLLKYSTYLVVGCEWVGPILFFIPYKKTLMRLIAIALFVGLHLGIDALLHIALFCYYPIAGLAALLPGEVWDKITPTFARPASSYERLRAPTPLGQCAWYLGICLWLISFYSAGPAVNPSIPYPKWMSEVNTADYGFQNWNLFIHPPRESGWYRGKATLNDGRVVDILQNGAPYTDDKPKDPSAIFPNRRWRRYIMQTGAYWSWSGLRRNLANKLVEQWNRAHPTVGDQVYTFELNYVMEGYEAFEAKNHPVHILKEWPVWTNAAVASSR